MKIFNLTETDNEIRIEIRGEIGGSWWNEGVTYDKVAAQLKGTADGKKKVRVRINSLGGDIDEALAIYELLLSMGDRVTTECYGRCASAATVIAMGGHQRLMSRYALFLVHKCWSGVVGNENVLEEALDEQRSINDRLAQIYADRTGTDKAKIEELMNSHNGDGEWLNADEAMEYGFITGQLPEEQQPAESNDLNEKIKNMYMFNHKKEKTMKKDIMSFAALAAVLEVQAMDASREGSVLMDDETLKKINDALIAKEQRADSLQTQLEDAEAAKAEAETAKAKAEAAKAEAETAKADLQAKVTEMEDKLAKVPSTAVNGLDTTPADDPQKEWENSDMYREAAERM